jgi:hypothetical protein
MALGFHVMRRLGKEEGIVLISPFRAHSNVAICQKL